MDPCPVLVGRQQELSTLRAMLDAGGGVALISGEAGIGKSRLVREFANEAVARGRLDLWARPEEVAQPGPYALIVDLLETIAEQGGSLKTEARALVNELTRPDTDGQRPVPAPRTVAAEIRGLVSQLGASPLIVLEDLHWADEQSHSVVLHLMRAARDDQHVVVATLRPEHGRSEESLAKLKDSLARERVAMEISLQPLSDAEMAEMLELLWRRPPTEGERAEFARLGEGVPFFIEELAGSDASGTRIPRNIEQSVSARVADLGEEASLVLRAASLMSGALDVAVLAHACDLPDESVARHLISATQAGLLVDVDGRLVFRHSLSREAVASLLVSVEAAQMHGRLAMAIEKIHAGDLDHFSSALANHYMHAGESASAVAHAIRWGDRSLAFAATEEARVAFQLALRLDETSTDALRGLAEVAFREGDDAEAARLFRQASEEFKASGNTRDAARALGRLSWALQGQVEPEHVIAVLDEGLALLSGNGRVQERARLMVQKGSIQCFLLNETNAARPTLAEALTIAEESDDLVLAAEALDGLAQIEELEARLDEAVALGRRATNVALKAGSPEVVGRTHNNFALKLAISGHPADALAVLDEARRYLRDQHGRAALGALDVSEAWVSWLMGRPGDVSASTARGRVAWQRWRGYRWVLETWSAIERGDNSRATGVVHEAWASMDQPLHELVASRSRWNREVAAAVLSEIYLRLGTDAAGSVTEATTVLVAFAREEAERFDFGQMLAAAVRVHLAAQQRDEAQSLLVELKALISEYKYEYLSAAASELEGLLNPDADRQTFHFDNAASSFARCGNASDQARCLRLLTTSSIRHGGNVDARTVLKQARSLAEEAGALVEVNRIDAVARSMGLRLRVGRTKKTDSNSLSARELEVAALVAEGQTNAGIAGHLYLSERTVQDHITHALRKLNLSSRAGLASWAARNGLL